MPNNIAVSITADVAGLTASRAIASAELQALRKDLNDLAKTAQTGGLTDEQRTRMLALGDASAKTKSQIALLDTQMKGFRSTSQETAVASQLAATKAQLEYAVSAEGVAVYKELAEAKKALTVATNAETAAHGSNRSATEALVIVHELLSGRLHRVAGSALIEAQALAGAEKSAAVFAAIVSPLGLAVIGTVVAMGAAAVATLQYEAAQRKITATAVGLGAASGLSADQIQEAGQKSAAASGQSGAAATVGAEMFAAAGVTQASTIAKLQGAVSTYAVLTGQKAAEANKQLAEAMQDPAKGAEELNAKLGILSASQLEQIRTLSEAGDKQGAVAIITAALTQRTDEAHAAGVGLATAFQTLIGGASNLWGWLGKVNQQLEQFRALGFAGGAEQAAIERYQGAVAHLAQTQAELNKESAEGRAVANETVAGAEAQKFNDLLAKRAVLQKAIKADAGLGDTTAMIQQSAALQAVNDAIGRVTNSQGQYITQAEREHEIVQLQVQETEAVKKHDAALKATIATKIAYLKAGDTLQTNDVVTQHSKDEGALAGAKGAAHAKAQNAVAEWEEALHTQEVASNDFFGDQTAKELAFWQSKVSLTQAGSKEWLAVQSKIYDAQKTLAHQAYDDHLATLNQQIEADKDSWSKEQSDWAAKLNLVRSTFGAESKEYQNAYREFEAAEREHQQSMREIARTAQQEQIGELKTNLASQEQVRKADAQAAEALINANSKYTPFGNIEASQQIAAINAQLRAQEAQDVAATYAKEDALRQQDIAQALAAGGVESAGYKKMLDEKAKADDAYYAAKRAKEAQDVSASIQDQLKIASAWHASIDPLVQSTGQNMVKLAEGTETWGQALQQIEGSVINMVASALEKMVENWIVQTITGGAQVKASNATTALSYAGVAGAAGVASMAAAPFPLDLAAPGFGASMYGAAAAYAGLASLAVGTNVVPSDMVAQIHAGERVMPAADNRAIMSMVAAGAGRGAGGAGDQHLHFGDFNIHGGPSGMSPGEFKKALSDHASHVANAVHAAARNGWRSNVASPFRAA